MELPITFSSSNIRVQNFCSNANGNQKIKIASGTESGTIIRLKGEGIKNVNDYRTGDQFINLKLKTPKKLNKKQEKLFKELSKLEE